MRCAQARSLCSEYLDNILAANKARAFEQHVAACAACRLLYVGMHQTQQLLSQASRRKAPEDLPLKLRLAISREMAQGQHRLKDYLELRLENTLRAFLIPAVAGLGAAVLLFGLFMGFSALPLQAGNADVPLMMNTAPQLEQSAFGTPMTSVDDDSLVIEAYVDSKGRVDDYRILSDSDSSEDLTPQVKSMLINFMTFTTFRPATSMGRPTPGRAILSFSRVNVKG
jgi:hypothetical protein